MKLSFAILSAFLLITLVSLSLITAPADAAAPTASRYVDDTGSNSGDCTNSSSPCRTISYAVTQAQSSDFIFVRCGTYVENVSITKSLILLGGDNLGDDCVTIDALSSGSTVRINSTATVTMISFNITGGVAGALAGGGGITIGPSATLNLSNSEVYGNGAVDGGAIFNSGVLTVENSSIHDNEASNLGGAIRGGLGSVTTVEDSVIEDNSAEIGGAFHLSSHGFFDNVTISDNNSDSDAAGIWSESRLVLVDSIISSNHAGEVTGGGVAAANGGGVLLEDGSNATIINTDLSKNSAESGGGLYAAGNTIATIENSLIISSTGSVGAGIYSSGNITVSNSTLTANRARLRGGGSFNGGSMTIIGSTIHANNSGNIGGGIESVDTLAVTNSTISGNTAIAGGGLFLHFVGGNDNVATLSSVTIAFNSASDDGGGIYAEALTSVVSSGSIIALNGVNGDCSIQPSATLTPLFANLNSDGSCPGFITGAALLGGLDDNGGLTKTHMLGSTSAAIDMGESSVCAALGNLDQRGISRVNVDGNGNSADGNPCDLGAVERPAATSPTAIALSHMTTTSFMTLAPAITMAAFLLLLSAVTRRLYSR